MKLNALARQWFERDEFHEETTKLLETRDLLELGLFGSKLTGPRVQQRILPRPIRVCAWRQPRCSPGSGVNPSRSKTSVHTVLSRRTTNIGLITSVGDYTGTNERSDRSNTAGETQRTTRVQRGSADHVKMREPTAHPLYLGVESRGG